VLPINVARNEVEAAIPVEFGSNAIAISPDGRFAYVTTTSGALPLVSKIDLATRMVVSTISLPAEAGGIAITPDGQTAYVALFTSPGAVVPIDLATETVGTAIPVDPFPYGVAISPDGSHVYVVSIGTGTLSRIDTATNTVGAVISGANGREISIAPDGDKAYAVESNGVTAVDLPSGPAEAPTLGAEFAADMAILPDGGRGYVVANHLDPEATELLPLNTSDNTFGTPFPVGGREGNAIAIVPNQPPHAAFAATVQSNGGATASSAGTGNGAVAFNASASTDPDGTVARYEWDFGDGTTVTSGGATPQHTYAKAGTYQVTLTETDNEGCSTQLVFTGQTAYCNGSSVARVTHPVTVGGGGSPTPHSHGKCIALSTRASSFVPKRRPGHVVPGVRVRVAPAIPAKVTIQATLLRRQGNVNLGKTKVEVRHWRRMRFVLPRSLRHELPLGTPVRVKVATTLQPLSAPACVLKKKQKPTVLDLHVVKVIPNRVQFKRGR
jgi:YVTN family beta-propeller protein